MDGFVNTGLPWRLEKCAKIYFVTDHLKSADQPR